jgi:ribosomal protein S3
VPVAETFEQVTQVLRDVLPSNADVRGISVSGDLKLVTIWTVTPGLVIGRQGATADEIRDGLMAAFGSSLDLRIEEFKEPPGEPSGGVREPRDPFPIAPDTGTARSGP